MIRTQKCGIWKGLIFQSPIFNVDWNGCRFNVTRHYFSKNLWPNTACRACLLDHSIHKLFNPRPAKLSSFIDTAWRRNRKRRPVHEAFRHMLLRGLDNYSLDFEINWKERKKHEHRTWHILLGQEFTKEIGRCLKTLISSLSGKDSFGLDLIDRGSR